MKYRVVQVQDNGDLSRIHTQAGAPDPSPGPAPSALTQHHLPRRRKLMMGERGKIKFAKVLNIQISLAKVNVGKILQEGCRI